MRGVGHTPLGWAATLLIAVAYSHVLLELAAAVLAVAIGVPLLIGPARSGLGMPARRHRRLERPWCHVVESDSAVDAAAFERLGLCIAGTEE